MAISTHTLTWSVTELPVESYLKYQDFNSHAHVERDLQIEFLSFLTPNFNSHAHVERDGVEEWICCIRNNFNSHAHVERDFRRHFSLSFLTISTHTLTWSVTVFTRSEAETFRISTHTLTWSVTFEECMWTLTP